ncbi:proline-rich receptor-like protein kinase PERK15 isoform X2 [Nymphaea colorata]|uniref:proline-rich receptor-like protein kinase PERK15 isoform X2 n=1 Tax=Nymphaea colorata TaxID=210225 RepID=UPI00129E53B8|nr:proline-rich receptor-like protein kinase PERK15 isoform X2 [Nymphaea colorata]
MISFKPKSLNWFELNDTNIRDSGSRSRAIKPMYVAAVIGGAAAALLLVIIVVLFVYVLLLKCKKWPNKSSETGSSEAQVEWTKIVESSLAGDVSVSEQQGTRKFTLEELRQATKDFSESNLIGEGRFGLIYKGLLHDGNLVAIKRRSRPPQQKFVEEVRYLSSIRNRNLVNLLGYCQEDNLQMLVVEYLPNGSLCNHLYEHCKDSKAHVEFKQRLSIAIGAAKGLCHLHSLSPPLVHGDFKTDKVFIDESIAKVADAGFLRLIESTDDPGPSNVTSRFNAFLDPDFEETGAMTEKSDVYSFGVFLLELITGQEASELCSSRSREDLIQWVEECMSSNNYEGTVDPRLSGSFTREGMKELLRLTLQCINFSSRRRSDMRSVESELERIFEKEMKLTTVMGEGTAVVTLGSQLFTSST